MVHKRKLERKGLAAAVSLDSKEVPVVYLLPSLTIQELIKVAAHEVVHLMQLFKGDSYFGDGYTIWKGKKYISLPSNDPNYFTQPWEKEAIELEPTLLKSLREYSEARFPQDEM